jgi:hypothetical protein
MVTYSSNKNCQSKSHSSTNSTRFSYGGICNTILYKKFWLDNWRSACSERLFSMAKSRYFMKAEVLIIQTFLTKLSARVFMTVTVVAYYHITIHIIFDIAFVICIQWLSTSMQTLWKAIAKFHFIWFF